MGALDLANHLLGFTLPALAVALLVTLAARWLLAREPGRTGAWAAFAINSIAGLAALAGGLWYFGRDGKMASYAALVLAVATSQWLCSRGWRR